MFTGIIQGVAKIIFVNEKKNFRTHIVEFPDHMLDNLEVGASISCNGCCLTVTKINGNHVSFDLIKETLNITNFCDLIPGDIINIERAIKFNNEIGGHIMSGHIMTTARITKILASENNKQVWFKLRNMSLMKYLLYKGFIGIDGISLTIGKITTTQFCVHLVSETLHRTTIGKKRLRNKVNIEIDLQTKAIVDSVENFMKRFKFNYK